MEQRCPAVYSTLVTSDAVSRHVVRLLYEDVGCSEAMGATSRDVRRRREWGRWMYCEPMPKVARIEIILELAPECEWESAEQNMQYTANAGSGEWR